MTIKHCMVKRNLIFEGTFHENVTAFPPWVSPLQTHTLCSVSFLNVNFNTLKGFMQLFNNYMHFASVVFLYLLLKLSIS